MTLEYARISKTAQKAVVTKERIYVYIRLHQYWKLLFMTSHQ